MGIYSANRSGSMTISQVSANENYTYADFGRIMYESAQNDQKLFEAVLANDFREIYALSEGTMLESEVHALNEKSAKEFFQSLLKRLKEFWAKIVGAIKSAINKITVFILKRGAVAVKAYDKVMDKYNGPVITLSNIKYPLVKMDIDRITKDIEVVKNIDDHKNFTNSNGTDTRSLINIALGNTISSGQNKPYTPKEYRKKMMDLYFTTGDIKSSDNSKIDMFKDILKNAGDTVKKLNTTKKNAEKSIKSAEKRIKKSMNGSETKAEDVKSLSTMVSVSEGVITATVSTAIAVVKQMAANSLSILNAIRKKASGTEVQNNSAFIEAAAEAEAEFDSVADASVGEEIDAEDMTQVDDVVDDAIGSDEF